MHRQLCDLPRAPPWKKVYLVGGRMLSERRRFCKSVVWVFNLLDDCYMQQPYY